MEINGKIITTHDEARQAIIDLFVEGIEEGFSSEIDGKVLDIAQEFSGLSGPSTMRLSRIKAEKIIEEKSKQVEAKSKQQDVLKRIKAA